MRVNTGEGRRRRGVFFLLSEKNVKRDSDALCPPEPPSLRDRKAASKSSASNKDLGVKEIGES